MVCLSCFNQERVLTPAKTKWLVAETREGDYEVSKFLINGQPPKPGQTIAPSEKLNIEVDFIRKVDLPDEHRIMGRLVAEMKETETLLSGSHSVMGEMLFSCRQGKGRHVIRGTIDAPNEKSADFAENHTLGRYFYLVIAENRSTIVSHRFEISK